MYTENINARVTYIVDDERRVICGCDDFHTVREAEDWLFEMFKAAYRHGWTEVEGDWESSGGVGATLQQRVI